VYSRFIVTSNRIIEQQMIKDRTPLNLEEISKL